MSERTGVYMVGRSGPAFGRAVRDGRRVGWVDRVDEAGVSSAIVELGGLPPGGTVRDVEVIQSRRGDDVPRRGRTRLPALPPYDPAADGVFPVGPVFRARRVRPAPRSRPLAAAPDAGVVEPPEWTPGAPKVPGVTRGLLAQLARGCRLRGLALPRAGYVWDERRRWAFDAAWPEQRVALALDGSVRLGRQESRGAGWIRDARQLNEAAVQGWRVLRMTPAQIEDGCVFDLVARALATPWRRA